MGIGDDLGPNGGDTARLVVQHAVGPFDRRLEAPRDEMSDRDTVGAQPCERIKRAQTARPLVGFDCCVGLIAKRVDGPSPSRRSQGLLAAPCQKFAKRRPIKP